MSKLSTPALSISDSVLTVSNIDDNATSIKLKKDGTDYKTLYTITETITNLTAATHDTLLASDGSLTISLTADGTSYKLPDEVSGSLPTGWSCTGATMSYSKTSDTSGSITLSSVASNISFTVGGISAGLATPTEVSVNSHDIMFLNATTEADAFEIYVDNVSLGTVSVSTLPNVSSVTAVDNELTVTVPDGTDAVGIFVDNVYLDAVDI